MMRMMFAQGDILIERVGKNVSSRSEEIPNDPDGAVVIGRGEESGHRHAIYGGGARLLAQLQGTPGGMPPELYVGHLVVEADTVRLSHEEHAAIDLPAGTYLVRRQRQFSAADAARQRLVED